MIRVILLPGLDGSGELLYEFASALAPNFDVTCVTYPPDSVLDYGTLVALARKTLPDAGPFVIVAESFSGPIAIRLAASRPPGLIGLVLCASFVRSPRPRLGTLAPLLALPVPLPPTQWLMPLMMGRWRNADWQSRVQATIRRLLPAVARRRLAEVLAVDETRRLSEIACPVLCLRASADRLVPPDQASMICSAVSRARCIDIDGPHFLLQARPDECAAAIRQQFAP